MGVISQNGIDYPVPSVPVQSDGSATDLTNAAVPTGQTIKSYLNSNLVVGKGNYNLAHSICAGYVTASGNYIDFFVPLLIDRTVTSITLTANPANPNDVRFFCKSANYSLDDIDTSVFSVVSIRKNGLRLELKFKTTKTASECAVVIINNLTLTFA